MLPAWLARTNEKGAPQRGLLVNYLFGIIIAAVFAFVVDTDLPPIFTLVPVGLGFGTLSVMIVQAIAALSVVVYFRRKRDPRLWRTFIAPGLGFLALPWVLVAAVVGGLGYAIYLKARRPQTYASLLQDLEDFTELPN